MPNLKNHTGLRPIVLSGDQGDVVTYVHGRAFKFFTKDLPPATGRLANYLVGFLVTWAGSIVNNQATPNVHDWDDIARGLFESCELRDTLLGKPISHNFYLGEFFGLAGFVGNGMEVAIPQPPTIHTTPGTGASTGRHSWFVPACSLLGMKGHHTAQLAVLYDRGTFEIKTAAAGVLKDGNGYYPMEFSNGTLEVTALLSAEPELRLGPGTQFVRYASTLGATQTTHAIDALGVTTSLQNVEEGAGIAFLAWMSNQRGFGGSWASGHLLEYLNFPIRGMDQLTHLDALYADYLSACNLNGNAHVQDYSAAANGVIGDAGPWANTGGLYGPAYTGKTYGLLDANFVPLVSPKKFLEASKLQSMQGTQTLYAKHNGNWPGTEDVFLALQYHSWTPAQEEEVLKKIITSGLAQTVWGTTDLVPSTKVANKQPAGSINPSKTRYFAKTWQPKEVVSNPPAATAKA